MLRSVEGWLSPDRDSCREAGAAGSPGRHSQEEPESVKPTVRENRATGCSVDPDRDGARPGTQQPIGQTRLAQQLLTTSRVTELALSAPASLANDSIPTIAANAIRAGR